jgi:mitosis inhibitor protein kinase SWE1
METQGSDDDDEGTSMIMGMGGTIGASGSLGGLARGLFERDAHASTSVSSIYSDVDQELVTPGFGPCSGSGWPDAVIVRGSGFDDAAHRGEGGIRVGMDGGGGSDGAFILLTLAAATNDPKKRRESEGAYGLKKMPGTLVKKAKTNHNLGGDWPWQSAVAAKVGFGVGWGYL